VDKLAYFRQLSYKLGIKYALGGFPKTAAGLTLGPTFLETLKSSWKPGLIGAGLGGVSGTVLGPTLNPNDHNAALHGMLMGGLGGAGAGVGQHLGLFGGASLFGEKRLKSVLRQALKGGDLKSLQEAEKIFTRYARSGQIAGGATGAAIGGAAGHALGKKKRDVIEEKAASFFPSAPTISQTLSASLKPGLIGLGIGGIAGATGGALLNRDVPGAGALHGLALGGLAGLGVGTGAVLGLGGGLNTAARNIRSLNRVARRLGINALHTKGAPLKVLAAGGSVMGGLTGGLAGGALGHYVGEPQ